MDTLRLGASGLEVSRIILGCMSYGDPAKGNHSWSLGLDESRPFFRHAIEAGITTFDTANVYSLGSSEEITGQLLGSSRGATRSSSRRRCTGGCSRGRRAAA